MNATMIKLKQGTQEWLDWRRNGITATEASCCMGVSKWGTALSVYNDKLNPKEHTPSEYEEWGTLLEDTIKFKKFGKEHPEFEVVQGECYEREWRKCSLDGELRKDGKTVAILEIKTGSDESAWDPVPAYYYAQVQWQMYVTGIERTYFAVLIHGHHYLERMVEYDPVYCQKLEEVCARVWECICKKEPPKVDPAHADIDQEVLNDMAVNATDKAPTHEISDEEFATYTILKEKVEEFEAKLKAQKAILTQYLTQAEALTYKGQKFGKMIVMKPRESVDTGKLKCEFPEVYEQVKKVGKPTAYPKFG